MLLFPADINSILAHLDERLAFDLKLVKSCQSLIESEAYSELAAAAVKVLVQRISQKSGRPAEGLENADWPARVDWPAAGFSQEQSAGLTSLCSSVLSSTEALPGNEKTGRAILLLVDLLLSELERLPDLAAPTVDLNARPFFEELIKSLNSLLPYEQRDFPAEIGPSKAKLLLLNLPEDAYYAVEIHPPAGGDPGRLAMGIHFHSDLEKLTRHFQRKVPGLAHSMGGKEIVLEEGQDRLSILLHQPYQPAEKMSAFMTAASLVGLIGSIQERMPRP